MEDNFIPDTRSEEEKLASIRYWMSKTPQERHAETVRLCVGQYGSPKGNRRDGPVRKYRIMPDGSREFVEEKSGPNPKQRAIEK